MYKLRDKTKEWCLVEVGLVCSGCQSRVLLIGPDSLSQQKLHQKQEERRFWLQDITLHDTKAKESPAGRIRDSWSKKQDAELAN